MASLYVTPRNVPYCPLLVQSAFKELTARQRLYAHHMMRAGWCGTAVVARQLSTESVQLLRVMHHVLGKNESIAAFKQAAVAEKKLSEEEVQRFLEYAALLTSNVGNYLSFGDSKFVPSCTRETFQALVVDADLVDAAYSLEPSQLSLGYPPEGTSAYYTKAITKEEIALVNEFLSIKKIDGVNTRVVKAVDGDSQKTVLTVLVASAEAKTVDPEPYKDVLIGFAYGDHSEELTRVVAELRSAAAFCENETEARMLEHYVRHFTAGDVDEHKMSQREWVKDIHPAVETNIGFIESYRDPSGVRAEWEGFVAVVNQEQSKQYAQLVAQAETYIAKLPWGKDYEKDVFSSPDFTSLEVLGFASSGIPIGINIPNYDDVRQQDGFKNVYLSNVVSAVNWDEKPPHITEGDWGVFKQNCIAAKSVNVGIHELLGHGTGKLLKEDETGGFNFDKETLVDPISRGPVTTWYKPGDTFGSVFGGIGSSYEECRAEAVSLYLCVEPDILSLFGKHTDAERADTVFTVWLDMVRMGLLGLEFYTPEKQQWRQAHMRARFCILRTLMEGPGAIVTIDEDAEDGLVVRMDRTRIATDGLKAIGDLLVNLSVNKSLAAAARGIAYYEGLTTVDETFLKYRDIVMSKRKPRKQYAQPHTRLNEDGSDVLVQEFEGSVEGVLEAFVTRYNDIPL